MAKGKKTGGRTKGTPNKITRSVREAVLQSFIDLGGSEALTAWAMSNQTEFYKIAARLIPTEIVGDPNAPVAVKVTFGGRYKPEGS
jgi:hypothetical protein